MVTIDNTMVEEALARAAPIRDQARELWSEARVIEGMALAQWYQNLFRQVAAAHVSPYDTMPWSVRRTANCFVDTTGKFVEPMELYRFVEAGCLDWLNL